ncbi:MAG: hypothetical protein V1873_00895 [Verrucomicrobiota bacterium]
MKPEWPKRLALAALSTLVALAAVELGLRLFFPQVQQHDLMFQYDPELGWTFLPDKRGSIVYEGEVAHYIRTNPEGFRDRPFPPPGEPVRRVIVIGDSFVSNISVGDDEVFTEQMEQRLPETTVMNCGVNGYGQVQEYLLLRRLLATYRPEVVVTVVYVGNDFHDNLDQSWIRRPRPWARLSAGGPDVEIVPGGEWHPAPPRVRSWSDRFWRGLHLRGFVESRADYFRHRLRVTGSKTRALSRYRPPELDLSRKKLSPESEEGYRVLERMLVRIVRLCKERGARCLFVVAPTEDQVDPERWAQLLKRHRVAPSDCDPAAPDRRLVEFAGREGLDLLDLLPLLRDAAAKGTPMYYTKEMHWTAEGNLVVADAVLDFIEAKGLLKD